MKNILIVGTGALGTLFAARLAASGAKCGAVSLWPRSPGRPRGTRFLAHTQASAPISPLVSFSMAMAWRNVGTASPLSY